MSTNKTENYQLHKWEPEDDFLRQEFNENFAAIDAALGELVVTGTYTGDNTAQREITLGFRPRAVIVFNLNGNQTQGGFACAQHSGVDNRGVELTDTGFRIFYNESSNNNKKTNYSYFSPYSFIAFQ